MSLLRASIRPLLALVSYQSHGHYPEEHSSLLIREVMATSDAYEMKKMLVNQKNRNITIMLM